MKSHRKSEDTEMREEYDFSKGIRGKYYKRFMKGANVVVLDPDVAKVFTNSKQVNDVLRTITRIARQTRVKAT